MAPNADPTTIPLPGAAEPGYTTTEFWAMVVSNGIALVSATLADFGVVHLTQAQDADITGLALLAITLGTGLYALGRSLRKSGTPA